MVGSTTHCDGYRAAALGRAGDVTTIGIDASSMSLPEGVLDQTSLPAERARRLAAPRMTDVGRSEMVTTDP